jgi:hypothetical protein
MKIIELLSEYINDPDVTKKLGGKAFKPDPAVKGNRLPNFPQQYPGRNSGLTDLSQQPDEQIAARAKIFIDKFLKSVPTGYPHWIDTQRGKTVLKLEYAGHTYTDNGINCFITGTTTVQTFNIFIQGITDQNKKPIFDVVTKLGFSLGRSATSNRQISVPPKNPTNVDGSIKDFWAIVEAIENLGKNFNASDEPNSAKKLNTNLTDISYFMGAAGLIFVATRFMSGNLPQAKKLLPTSTNKGDGTFDIAPGIITRGVTQTAYDVQHRKIPYQPLTSVFAVPPDVIIEAVQNILRNGNTDKLKITSTMRDDIIKAAELLRKNLVLIRCTQAEKEKVEAIKAMPGTWTPTNGKVLARFQELGIQVYSTKDGTQLAEDDWE